MKSHQHLARSHQTRVRDHVAYSLSWIWASLNCSYRCIVTCQTRVWINRQFGHIQGTVDSIAFHRHRFQIKVKRSILSQLWETALNESSSGIVWEWMNSATLTTYYQNDRTTFLLQTYVNFERMRTKQSRHLGARSTFYNIFKWSIICPQRTNKERTLR
jgi:hypothetical protein